MKSENLFSNIVAQITAEHDNVLEGKMMSSPALKLNGKVFVFSHKNSMTFKFQKETELYKSQYPGSSYLSPFKNKPPMRGWLTIPAEFQGDWLKLTKACLELNN